MQKRDFTNLDDLRLGYCGNKILIICLAKVFIPSRRLAPDEASAKGFYRFLHNDKVNEDDVISNLSSNCKSACKGK